MALITIWYSYYTAQKDSNEAETAQRELLAERFSDLTTLRGDSVSFDPLDGRVKVVTHWASWCATCIDELKSLDTLAGMLDNETVDVYAFNRGDSRETAMSFMEAFNLTNLTRITYLLDGDDLHFSVVGGYTMPETIIYDGGGDVVEHYRGALNLGRALILLESMNEDL